METKKGHTEEYKERSGGKEIKKTVQKEREKVKENARHYFV